MMFDHRAFDQYRRVFHVGHDLYGVRITH